MKTLALAAIAAISVLVLVGCGTKIPGITPYDLKVTGGSVFTAGPSDSTFRVEFTPRNVDGAEARVVATIPNDWNNMSEGWRTVTVDLPLLGVSNADGQQASTSHGNAAFALSVGSMPLPPQYRFSVTANVWKGGRQASRTFFWDGGHLQ